MKSIIRDLRKQKWSSVENAIKSRSVVWDTLVDSINPLIHFMAYHNQLPLIRKIKHDTIMKLLLETNSEGDTICHIGAKLNNLELIEFVMSIRPEILYYQNRASNSPLFYLVYNTDFITKFVKKTKVRDHYIDSDTTLLDHYIINQNEDMVKELLENLEINSLSCQSIFTLIMTDNFVSVSDSIKYLEMMLNTGLDVNCLDKTFLSPLIVSIAMKKKQITKFLIDAGADIDYSGGENEANPLALAIISGQDDTVKLLLNRLAKTNIRNSSFRIPLHFLFSLIIDKNKKMRDLPDLLPRTKKKIFYHSLEKGEINQQDIRLNTPLHLICQNDRWQNYAKILIHAPLDIHLKNRLGKKPIDYIAESDKDDFFSMVCKSYIWTTFKKEGWSDSFDQEIWTDIRKTNNVEEVLEKHKTKLLDRVVNSHSYPQNDMYVKLTMIVAPPVNVTSFTSYTYNYLCSLYYLLDKYRGQIIIPYVDKKIDLDQFQDDASKRYPKRIVKNIVNDYLEHSPKLAQHLIILIDTKVRESVPNCLDKYVPPYFGEGLQNIRNKYPDVKFILIKLTLICYGGFNHANMLIYDTVNNIIERFDPYGSVPYYDNEFIDNTLRHLFMESLPSVTYLSTKDVTDGISFQIFSSETTLHNMIINDPAGFCQAWCLWYVEQRILNPKLSPQLLTKLLIHRINKLEERYKDYIRNYASILDTTKNKIMQSANVSKKYWYATQMPQIYQRRYLDYMSQSFDSIFS